MVEPKRAIVRPRVVSASGETLLLEDEVESLLDRGRKGTVWILGDPGKGKTTALAHLAAKYPSDCLELLDEGVATPDPDSALKEGGRHRLTLRCGQPDPSAPETIAVYHLADWGIDEILEYLMAVHPAQCRSVMTRCQSAKNRQDLQGSAELWTEILDTMAADSTLSVDDALICIVDRRLPRGEVRGRFAKTNLALLAQGETIGLKHWIDWDPTWNGPEWRLLRNMPIRIRIAAEQLAEMLQDDMRCPILLLRLPDGLLREAARWIAADETILEGLRTLLRLREQGTHPTAASLLHATKTGWKPERRRVGGGGWAGFTVRLNVPNLHGAQLEGAIWPGVRLDGLDLSASRLCDSELSQAILAEADLSQANLSRSNLSHANLERASAWKLSLVGAKLTKAIAIGADFRAANARGADFTGADLTKATFCNSNLTGARFVGANLSGSNLNGAEIEGADFSDVNFTQARLTRLIMRLANFQQCNFCKAELRESDLEGMALPNASFAKADFDRALLTGTFMPRTSFWKAKLTNTGLAEIEWEQADLRNADLRGATFHMGSSRSGLVQSTIASYGTRTGFYTDDYNDQDFKAPEEIRKANLRGADLRGANLDGVDFYLVDLRDALYDASRAKQLRGTGAILESRVR